MLRPGGYAVWTEPGERERERDTITCAHCNGIVFVEPGKDPGGFCRLCYRHLCTPCADAGVCTPFEKRLDQAEKRKKFLTAVGVEE